MKFPTVPACTGLHKQSDEMDKMKFTECSYIQNETQKRTPCMVNILPCTCIYIQICCLKCGSTQPSPILKKEMPNRIYQVLLVRFAVEQLLPRRNTAVCHWLPFSQAFAACRAPFWMLWSVHIIYYIIYIYIIDHVSNSWINILYTTQHCTKYIAMYMLHRHRYQCI